MEIELHDDLSAHLPKREEEDLMNEVGKQQHVHFNLPLSLPSSSSSSPQLNGQSIRFIPNRKRSMFPLLLCSAREVKENVTPKKGSYISDDNEMSVTELYKQHVLGLSRDLIQSNQLMCTQSSCKQSIIKRNEVQKYQEGTLTEQEDFQPASMYRCTKCQSQNESSLREMIMNLKGKHSEEANPFHQCRTIRKVCPDDISTNPYKRNYQKEYRQFKVLDAPGLVDDFYLNLLDWSSKNIIAVGLGSSIFSWNGFSNEVQRLWDVSDADSNGGVGREGNTVASVQWSPLGGTLGIGDTRGFVSIMDALTSKVVSELKIHDDRVGSLAWNGENLLASGSRDRSIVCSDIRVKSTKAKSVWSRRKRDGTTEARSVTEAVCVAQRRFLGHRQEVCGLKWSNDEQYLASGGNDNTVFVWSLRSSSSSSSSYLHRFTEHKAGVKALAWSPHQHGILATGGGTADRMVRFWNVGVGKQVDCVEVNSQVCNIVFSKNSNEFVTTHGYSENDVVLWRLPSLQRVMRFTGHKCRVLQLALSPCSTKVVTGAGDETLRFWNIFQPAEKSDNRLSSYGSSQLKMKTDLR